MLGFLSRPMVRLVDRYLPDPFVFVLILTLVAGIAAALTQEAGPLDVITYWGDGFWSLLSFSMQMLLVLVTGYLMASTPLVRRGLAALAGLASSAGGAIVLVSLVSLAASWINWGFGLVVGALFAKELARQIKVDYRLLVASAYSGFIVWHGGLAGSIPLSIATEGHPFAEITGVVPTAETIFAPFNLMIVVALFIAVPLVNRAMMPSDSDSVYVDPALLKDDPFLRPESPTPAERLENGKALSVLIGAAGVAWLIQYFAAGGGLSLNVINFLFLTLAILLHGTPKNLLNALGDAVKGGAGIVIQFPFYAGIMAIMVQSGLAASISEGLVGLASATTLPFWSFVSAGIVNFFVPSGGGQWAVQAPVILPAAEALGADLARTTMAVAWGDAWTNMVQPFWALPILGIAGLRAKDIMGFCVVHLILSGVIIAIGLTFLQRRRDNRCAAVREALPLALSEVFQDQRRQAPSPASLVLKYLGGVWGGKASPSGRLRAAQAKRTSSDIPVRQSLAILAGAGQTVLPRFSANDSASANSDTRRARWRGGRRAS